jgi:hypothetical protein
LSALEPSNLVSSEILLTLVDEERLSEASPEYMVTQKVARSGWSSLTDDERRLYRTRVAPLLHT